MRNLGIDNKQKTMVCCKKETWRTIRTKHYFNLCVILSVPVRLIGAKVGYGGRVEVFYRRRWGKICRIKWDINDAKVVCLALEVPWPNS